MSTNPPEGQSYQPPTPGSSSPTPGYPAAPPAPQNAPTPHGPSTLGIVAFVVALVAVVVGSILAYVAGANLGALAQYGTTSGSSYSLDESSLDAEGRQAAATGGLLTVVTFVAYGALALWGFIQGIVAAVKKRGRGWGIAAIVLAVIGGGIVGVVYVVAIGVGAAPYLAV